MSLSAISLSSGPSNTPAALAPSPQGSSEAAPLLPTPELSTMGAGDALSLLYFFVDKEQGLSVNQGTKKISVLQTERDKALEDEKKAIAQEAIAAKQHSFWDDLGGLFGDIAKVAGVVASVAALACTCGAATPIVAVAIAGVILSTASAADGEFHILQALGVDPKIAGWIDLGLSCAGGASSMGATLFAGGAAAASGMKVLEQTATVAAGAATVVQGTATIEGGQAQAQAEDAEADQVMAQAKSDHALRLVQMIIDEMQSADKESGQMLATIASAKGTLNQTATDAAVSVRG